MRMTVLNEEMYDEIKSCMDSGAYEQTVQEQGGEPKTPEERRSFVMAYLHNDMTDRNGEARAAYRAEHEMPPLSLMKSDPIEYNRREHEFHDKFPIKTFTDVVKEQTGITIQADLSGRMYFEKDDGTEQKRDYNSVKKVPVTEQLEKQAEKLAAQKETGQKQQMKNAVSQTAEL